MENESDHFLITEKTILNLARLGGVTVEPGGGDRVRERKTTFPSL